MSKCSGEIEINGEVYVRKGLTPSAPVNSNIKIVVLQRGWVMIGRFSRKGNQCKLDNACVIRVWGTTNGLGELAANGPTSSTKLDKTGTVEFNELTAVVVINCEEQKWDSLLV